MHSGIPDFRIEWTMLSLSIVAIVLLPVHSATGSQAVAWILYGLLGCIGVLVIVRMCRNLKIINQVSQELEIAGEAYTEASAKLEARLLDLYRVPSSDQSAVSAALNKVAEADGVCDRARTVLEEKMRAFHSLPLL